MLFGSREEVEAARSHVQNRPAPSDRVYFGGHHPNAAGFIHLAYFNLLPSTCPDEPTPSCLYEALLAGKPSITTHVGSIREIMGGGGIPMPLKKDNKLDEKVLENAMIKAIDSTENEHCEYKRKARSATQNVNKVADMCHTYRANYNPRPLA